MTVGGLFEGIGGFPLAAQWAGLTPIWSNEIDPFCCKVLRKNFNHRIIEDDIRNIGAHNLEPVDIITGGFPCPPFSIAGKRKGKSDDRHLWPEMLRVIREVKPSWVVGENVRGLLSIEGGLVFEQMCTDLEDSGYEVVPLIIPACAVNAPHRRDRVWIVAKNANGNGRVNQRRETESGERGFRDIESGITERVFGNEDGIITDPKSKRSGRLRIGKKTEHAINGINGINGASSNATSRMHQGTERHLSTFDSRDYERGNWQDFPTVSPVCGGDARLPNRVDRIKALGNAIVPQVALELFKAIKSTEI